MLRITIRPEMYRMTFINELIDQQINLYEYYKPECKHSHTRTCTQAHTHTRAYTHTHASTHVHTRTRMCTSIQANTWIPFQRNIKCYKQGSEIGWLVIFQ